MFPGRLLTDGEQVVLHTRTHAKVLLGAVLTLLATAFAAGLLLALLHQHVGEGVPRTASQIAVVAVAVVVAARWVVRPFLRWYTTTYTFTDRRLVQRSGLVARVGRTIPLNRVNGVDYEMGLLDRLWGCGTLVVSDARENGSVPLHDIPRVEEAQRVVAEQLHRVAAAGLVADDGT